MPISVCNKVKMLCARSQNAARPSRLQMRVLTTFSAESAFGPPPRLFLLFVGHCLACHGIKFPPPHVLHSSLRPSSCHQGLTQMHVSQYELDPLPFQSGSLRPIGHTALYESDLTQISVRAASKLPLLVSLLLKHLTILRAGGAAAIWALALSACAACATATPATGAVRASWGARRRSALRAATGWRRNWAGG